MKKYVENVSNFFPTSIFLTIFIDTPPYTFSYFLESKTVYNLNPFQYQANTTKRTNASMSEEFCLNYNI